MKNKKENLEEISLAFTNDELIVNPLSKYSNKFRKELKCLCKNEKDVSVNVKLSAYFRIPAYLVSAKGKFKNIQIFLDNLTNKDLVPYFYYAPPDLIDKILNEGQTGTTKFVSDYYKKSLKEKGYHVYKSDFDIASNYKVVKNLLEQQESKK